MNIPQIQRQLAINRSNIHAAHQYIGDCKFSGRHLASCGRNGSAQCFFDDARKTTKKIARMVELQKALKEDMKHQQVMINFERYVGTLFEVE